MDIEKIDTYKRANCQALMALNQHWVEVAYGRSSLEIEKILGLVKKMKAQSHSMQNICEDQEEYVPWRINRKRCRNRNRSSEGSGCKSRK